MQFQSYIFILVFLPVLVIAYFQIGKLGSLAGRIVLICGSAVFYAAAGWKAALVLGVDMALTWGFSLLLRRVSKHRKLVLFISIAAVLFVLGYFKYYNFFAESSNTLFHTQFSLRGLWLPLGISFITFQQIMYLVNIYRKTLQARLADYLLYILYFPKLLMGPLTEPADLIAQFHDPSRKKVNWENISCGLKLFGFGLFKKAVIADTLALAVSWGFSNTETATSMDWFIVMLCYTFQIYFDFSGYSDMATGISAMLNIDLPMNFDSPYKSFSIREFWKRWHISLTTFLTKYLYIPLGGSKKGSIRTGVNMMIVFLVSGFWHGASFTFIVWGALHGLISVIERIFAKPLDRLFSVVRWGYTFLAVGILWLLYCCESLTQWTEILAKMFSFQNMQVSEGLLESVVMPETVFLNRFEFPAAANAGIRGFSLLILLTVSFLICLIPENNYRNRKKNGIAVMIFAALLFAAAFLCLGGNAVFIYNNF